MMKRPLYMIPAGLALAMASVMFLPEPAFAYPTCEQEIMIRCSGYAVQGRGRLDIYYDSYEECVEAETFAQCPPDYAAKNAMIKQLLRKYLKADA